MPHLVEVPPGLKDLVEATSTGSKIANRLWLALMIVSVYVLLPNSSAGVNLKTLPFSLGSVPTKTFHTVAFPMVSYFLIAFCAAHAHQIGLHHMLKRRVKASGWTKVQQDECLRLFHVLHYPTLFRVSPLADAVTREYALCFGRKDYPRGLQNSSMLYYLVVKAVAIIPTLVVPGAAFFLAFLRFRETAFVPIGILNILIGASAIIAGIVWLFAFTQEILWVIHVVKDWPARAL